MSARAAHDCNAQEWEKKNDVFRLAVKKKKHLAGLWAFYFVLNFFKTKICVFKVPPPKLKDTHYLHHLLLFCISCGQHTYQRSSTFRKCKMKLYRLRRRRGSKTIRNYRSKKDEHKNPKRLHKIDEIMRFIDILRRRRLVCILKTQKVIFDLIGRNETCAKNLSRNHAISIIDA